MDVDTFHGMDSNAHTCTHTHTWAIPTFFATVSNNSGLPERRVTTAIDFTKPSGSERQERDQMAFLILGNEIENLESQINMISITV